MGDLPGYDAWLEKPYQDMYAESDAYISWCESNKLDPSDDNWDDFHEAMEDYEPDFELMYEEEYYEEKD